MELGKYISYMMNKCINNFDGLTFAINDDDFFGKHTIQMNGGNYVISSCNFLLFNFLTHNSNQTEHIVKGNIVGNLMKFIYRTVKY